MIQIYGICHNDAIFGIRSLKILSVIQLFYICPNVKLSGHDQSFKSQGQQKLAKKITNFTIHFRSKHLTHFMNLNSLDIENNMLPQHSQKLTLQIFQQTCFTVWCQKKHLRCTTSWRPRIVFLKHIESRCLYISAYLRKKIFFPRYVVRFYVLRAGFGGGWIICLRRLAVLAS